MMFESEFAERLAALRTAAGVSAREMSLAIGQNASYINRIENGKTFPSMQVFFYICEYLNVTPQEFFGEAPIKNVKYSDLCKKLEALSDEQFALFQALLKQFLRS